MLLPRTPVQGVAFLLLMQLATVVRAEDNQTMLFDFSKPDSAEAWQTVNDGVMGGVSDGKVRITEKTLEFYGALSLENNGGFASVRSKAAKMDLSMYDGLVFKVRGDGREYYLNLHVPTNQIAFSYRASFKTENDKWNEVTIPFKDLKATSFGRVVEKGKPLNPSNVESVGFLLANKKVGPFQLEVSWIKGLPKAGK
jgi:NADH dehydrogenase [ubiquinone] 1 alpha subcomplex assembly factor 1